MSNSSKTSLTIMHEKQELNFIFRKIQSLNYLNDKIKVLLPKSLTEHCRVANLQGKKLIFLVTNGAFATELRYQMNSLLAAFKKDPELRNITEIDFKVRPFSEPLQQRESQKPPMPPLSNEAAASIKATAETLTDPELKEIMERLSKHT